MNWNRPLAEDVLALAWGLRFDSTRAVVSRYSKLAPVAEAALRIAPVTPVPAALFPVTPVAP